MNQLTRLLDHKNRNHDECTAFHKDGNPLRPSVSSIGTYTYELSKFLADILKPLSNNQYTVRDSFSFANELLNLNDVHHMASFDVSSLFTNIPFQETIDI